MERWIGSVAIVTGASVGIGEAVVEQLVEQGINVVGIARRKEHLAAIEKRLSSKKGKFHGFPGDVSKEDDILKAFKWTKENVGPVSILVNNAGVIITTPLSETPTKDWANLLNINILALCIATREAIKQMNENNIAGHIVNMNSVLGHKIQANGSSGFYSASKHAITALTESLRLELATAGSKIKITSISPGSVITEMRSKVIDELTGERKENFSNAPSLKASDVADATIFALSTPADVQIPEVRINAVGEVL